MVFAWILIGALIFTSFNGTEASGDWGVIGTSEWITNLETSIISSPRIKFSASGTEFCIEVDIRRGSLEPETARSSYWRETDGYEYEPKVGLTKDSSGRSIIGFTLWGGTLKLPSTPSYITVPATVKGGGNLNISWGSSIPAVTFYDLERSVNGGSYEQIYRGSDLSYTDTTKKEWNNARYRVEAINSRGYSGYKNSSFTTVINNTNPIIEISSPVENSYFSKINMV